MIRAKNQVGKRFVTTFTNGEHVALSDVTPEKGGENLGFRPHELLEAALATCMNMTVRMAAEKRGIDLAGVTVTVSLNRDNPETPIFEYGIEFQGDLTAEQKERLTAVLKHCPVHKTLSQPLQFRFEEDGV